ncbi:undecaprenyl-phosphate galactose phosphotransferase WbaP [Thermospira aquatica]|uniref:Undecaprenyl-phosphate galactose phosphotransferase WbaP n=1 Tax=Thermospira aquatica TaxID=2828656 RepID=A0AAX3BC37_9SPIR|nr:undecaprenyl-phosphate galactose phosphotransferase WbaP [Thermospira aquatica]URA09631.1 undecaprenyl-phosphate galactose phosphotransferase WbaP [Thermospira aquatica]
MKYLRKIMQFFILLASDLMAYYASLAIAVFLRQNIAGFFFSNLPSFNFQYEYFASVLWLPLAFVFSIGMFKLYHRHFSFWEETEKLVKALTLGLIIVFFVISIRKLYADFSRLTLLFLWGSGLFFFALFRYIFKKLLWIVGLWGEDVLILGKENLGEELSQKLSQDSFLGFRPKAILSPTKGKRQKSLSPNKIPVYYEKDISGFIRRLGMETVFIITEHFHEKDLDLLASEAYASARNIVLFPLEYPIVLFNAETHYLLKERSYLIYAKNNLNAWWNLFLKRTIDIVGSLVGLVLLSPLLLVVAFIIKLTSPGKIVYKQQRIGKNGKPFYLYKFRSMYPDADERLKDILASDPKAKEEWETKRKLTNDPRITPIGKFIRKTSIDELPQLWNILKGDISIVGPRPVSAEEIEKFYKEYQVYYYSVRPGLTGLWQVSGRSNTDYNYRVQTDVWYVENWSLWLDIVIILKTFEVLIKREGAY